MELTLKIKTEYQLTVELRNEIAKQIVGQDLSAKYWELKAQQTKPDTQERVDALAKVAANKKLSEADRVYLKIIDKKIAVLKE